ncbi:HNH endonuclease signature motif containing protein [Streptomyces xanthophaeus]|uniref:HNH endonuclease signature motif containing protein n=1 Tax=Streptomyces xanthophaeus TaxID=67385 RepID=UPI00131E61B9|nr:HNH endonuclease signature motif containing protein [Streptomyces xanthophaeus]
MVLLANRRRCVYCNEAQSETLEHEAPLAGAHGRDVWWNLVPACDQCNRWKSWKNAAEWQRDMKLQYAYPKESFARNLLPLRTVEGIKGRVAQVQREIQDSARRQWFQHHYGRERTPRRRAEKHVEVQRCAEELERYIYPPWTSEEIRPAKNSCMRALCCGYQRKEAVPEYVTLTKTEREDLERMAYERGLYLGDLIGTLLRPEIEKWRKDRPVGHDTNLGH